jgi:NitT/TauT family transport system substrate-binding protein
MKKLLALIISVMVILGVSACEPASPAESYTLMAPDGAPGVVISKIVNDGTVYGKTVNASIVGGAEEISANVTNGSADMAVMPLNLAAKLYNGGVKIKLVSVNIFGSLYMVGKTQINGVSDLVGQVVYNIGRGGTPDLTFKYILKSNNIEFVESETAVEGKVALQYVAAASELVPLLKTNKASYGIMGEPAVTNCNKAAGTVTVLNIQEQWKAITGEDYTQAGFVVSDELASNRYFMNALCKVLEENEEWCKTNASSIKDMLKAKGSTLTIDYTAELLGRCNVGYKSAALAKNDVESYFNVLLGFNPKVIGEKLPDDNFYYGYTTING